MRPHSALTVILLAGLVCGTFDGISATIASMFFGGTPIRLFQGVASGLLGRSAFQGGMGTALLGVFLHFGVASGAAFTYYAASRWLPIMLERALVCGVIFGALTHLFMTFIVIPLSKIGIRPFAPKTFMTFLIISMVVVGPAISLTVRRFSGR